jgi:valyl-tRNA synthetase
MNLTITECHLPPVEKLELEDKWVLTELNRLIQEVTTNLESYEIGVASAKVYDFIWDTYCDWYIELTKTRMTGDNAESREVAENVLCYVLTEILKLLHPFMPFISEEIWQSLPHEGEYLMTSHWPEVREELNFPSETDAMEAVMDTIKAVRARRAEMNVPPSKKAEMILKTDEGAIYEQGIHFINRLAYASDVKIQSSVPENLDGMVTIVTNKATAYIPMNELVDFEKELERIAKEREKAENGLRITEKKLANEKFVANAPEAVVNVEREKIEKYRELISKLDESMKALKG